MFFASLLALAVAVLHKDRHGLVIKEEPSSTTEDATSAPEATTTEAEENATTEADSEATSEADANATTNASSAAPDAAMRCELLLDVSLDDIHKHGGIEAFANAAQSELAHAAEVEPTCVHILNLRGKYEQGMDALNLMQLLKRFLRNGVTKVVVDFEILPECKASYGTAVEKVQTKLSNETSALRTGWLHTFLSSHSKVIKAHGASDKWMEEMTMATKPVEEPTSAAAAAILIAFFAAQA
jgi:hypothetical protein